MHIVVRLRVRAAHSIVQLQASCAAQARTNPALGWTSMREPADLKMEVHALYWRDVNGRQIKVQVQSTRARDQVNPGNETSLSSGVGSTQGQHCTCYWHIEIGQILCGSIKLTTSRPANSEAAARVAAAKSMH